MKSIQTRLASGLLISLMLVLSLLWLIISHNIQNLSEQYISTRIVHDIDNLITAITFDKNNHIKINEQYINPIYKRPFSGHYYLIQFNHNNIRSRSLWDQSLTVSEASGPGYQTSYQQGPEKQSLIVLSRQLRKKNKQFTISIAEDLTPVTQAIDEFMNYFSMVSIILLIILVIIQIIVLRSGLQPLRKIHDELSQLEKGEIDQLSTTVPDELKPVVNEINQLSQTLHKRLKRSRDALSDLSHAIKKPLTVLQHFSEQQSELKSDSQHTLNTQIQSIHNITDHILKRARVAGRSKANKCYDLNQDLNLLIKTIRTIYPDKTIEADLQLPDDLLIQIDREDMLELLGNLIDNAWKWANNKVLIRAKQNQLLQLSIEDDGNGQDAASLNELMNRGVRLDESVSGYGFGLAIATDIVSDYDGSLHFSQSPSLGGFKAEISIPVQK